MFCDQMPKCKCRGKCHKYQKDFKLLLEVMAIKFWKGGLRAPR